MFPLLANTKLFAPVKEDMRKYWKVWQDAHAHVFAPDLETDQYMSHFVSIICTSMLTVVEWQCVRLIDDGDLTKLTGEEINVMKKLPVTSMLVEALFEQTDRYCNEQAGHTWENIAGMV